jgi:hypothetical protein
MLDFVAAKAEQKTLHILHSQLICGCVLCQGIQLFFKQFAYWGWGLHEAPTL